MVSVEGLNGYKYKANSEYESDKDTECFCIKNCSFDMLNISSCWGGLPVFMSYPKFGNDSKQQSYIVIEDVSCLKTKFVPNVNSFFSFQITGIPIEVRKTYELNVLLKPYPYPIFQNVNNSLYVPVVSYQDHWKIDPEFANHIRNVLNSSSEIRTYGALAIILGVSLWIARGFFSVLEWKRNRGSDPSVRTLLNDALVAEEG